MSISKDKKLSQSMSIESTRKRLRVEGPEKENDVENIAIDIIRELRISREEIPYLSSILRELYIKRFEGRDHHRFNKNMVGRTIANYKAMAKLQGKNPMGALSHFTFGKKEAPQEPPSIVTAIIEDAHRLPKNHVVLEADLGSNSCRPPVLYGNDSWKLTKRAGEFLSCSHTPEDRGSGTDKKRQSTILQQCRDGGLPLRGNPARAKVLNFDQKLLESYLVFILALATLHDDKVVEDTVSIILYTWGDKVLAELKNVYEQLRQSPTYPIDIPWDHGINSYKFLRRNIELELEEEHEKEIRETKMQQNNIKRERLNASNTDSVTRTEPSTSADNLPASNTSARTAGSITPAPPAPPPVIPPAPVQNPPQPAPHHPVPQETLTYEAQNLAFQERQDNDRYSEVSKNVETVEARVIGLERELKEANEFKTLQNHAFEEELREFKRFSRSQREVYERAFAELKDVNEAKTIQNQAFKKELKELKEALKEAEKDKALQNQVFEKELKEIERDNASNTIQNQALEKELRDIERSNESQNAQSKAFEKELKEQAQKSNNMHIKSFEVDQELKAVNAVNRSLTVQSHEIVREFDNLNRSVILQNKAFENELKELKEAQRTVSLQTKASFSEIEQEHKEALAVLERRIATLEQQSRACSTCSE